MIVKPNKTANVFVRRFHNLIKYLENFLRNLLLGVYMHLPNHAEIHSLNFRQMKIQLLVKNIIIKKKNIIIFIH